jgi:hypothetical protein
MICDSSNITKKHIDEVINYSCEFVDKQTYRIFNKEYEVIISYLSDNMKSNMKKYIFPKEPVNNFYFNSKGLLFNIDYEDFSEEILKIYELHDKNNILVNDFIFLKPKTLYEMELFIEKIKENPYLKFKEKENDTRI